MTETSRVGDERWHDLGPAAEIAPGALRAVRVGGRTLCVGRGDGGYFAIDDSCPHAGGSLAEGMVDGDQVICPLHAFAFDVRTGQSPDDPGCAVRSHPIRIEDGILQVKA